MRQRREFEADLAEEVRFHREMAGAQFGSEALALEDSRAAWGFAWWDSFRQDLRYALRGFRRTPGFALTVIGTIGLGLGLNTTLFTVFKFPHADAVGQSLAIHGATGGDPYYSRMPAHRTAVVNWTSTDRATECLYLPTSATAAHNGSLLVRVKGRKTLVYALNRAAPSLADFINPMDHVLAVQV